MPFNEGDKIFFYSIAIKDKPELKKGAYMSFKKKKERHMIAKAITGCFSDHFGRKRPIKYKGCCNQHEYSNASDKSMYSVVKSCATFVRMENGSSLKHRKRFRKGNAECAASALPDQRRCRNVAGLQLVSDGERSQP